MQSRKGGGAVNIVSRFFTATKQSFFQVLFLSNKKATTAKWRSWVNMGTRIIQLLAFTVSSNVGAPWPPSLNWLTSVTSVFNLTILNSVFNTPVYLALYYSAIALVVVLLALLLFGMFSFARNSFAALWPLRLLRFLGNLAAGPLFIPVLQMLSSVLACSTKSGTAQNTVSSAFSCSGPGFVAQEVVSIILGFCLFAFALTFAAVFFESHPLSTSLESKAHGRADIMLLFVQAVLVLAVETFSQRIALWLLLTLLGVGGLVWFGAFFFFLPYYAHWMNSLNTAGAMTFIWAFIALCVNNFYDSMDAAVMLYCGLPFAAYAGWSAATWRANRIINTPASRLTGPFEVELKARFLLHTALHGHPLHKIPPEAMSPTLAAFQAGAVQSLAALPGKKAASMTVTKGASTGIGSGGGDGSHTPGKDGDGGSGSAASVAAAAGAASLDRDGFNAAALEAKDENGTSGGTAMGVAADQESAAIDDLDERAAALRKLIPPAMLSEVAGLYRSAAARMRSSALIFLFQSRFCGAFLGNKHLQTSALLAAERRRPSLDVAFLVYQARRANEDSSSSGGGVEMSALARISYEKHSADARRNVLLAAQKQASFWSELLDPMPDLSRLHRLSSETFVAVQAAESAFSELSALNNQSIAVIRLYAAFNLIVLGNAEKASILTAEADRLEDSKAKDHRAEGQQRLSIMAESSLDLWAENTALLTVSARSSELGLVLTANSSALKMFGYSRLQLERRSAFTLLPPPLDAWTETSLRRYTAFGAEGNELVGHSRVLFAAGKSGAIFPVLSSIRDAPSETADGNRSFLWIVRELRSSTSFILCNPVFGILAACASSLSLLQLEVPALANRDIALVDFITELGVKSVVEELTAGGNSSGVPLRVDVTVAAEEEDEGEYEDGDDNNDSLDGAGSVSEGEDDREDGRETIRQLNSVRMSASETAKLLSPTTPNRTASARNGSGSAVLPRRASALGPSAGAFDNKVSVWVRAHLQRIQFDGLSLWVLHWSRIPPSESHAIAKAEVRRTQILQQAGLMPMISGSNANINISDPQTAVAIDSSNGGSGFFAGPAPRSNSAMVQLRLPTSPSDPAKPLSAPPGLVGPGKFLRRKASGPASGPAFASIPEHNDGGNALLPGAVASSPQSGSSGSPLFSNMMVSSNNNNNNGNNRGSSSDGEKAADADLIAILGLHNGDAGAGENGNGGGGPVTALDGTAATRSSKPPAHPFSQGGAALSLVLSPGLGNDSKNQTHSRASTSDDMIAGHPPHADQHLPPIRVGAQQHAGSSFFLGSVNGRDSSAVTGPASSARTRQRSARLRTSTKKSAAGGEPGGSSGDYHDPAVNRAGSVVERGSAVMASSGASASGGPSRRFGRRVGSVDSGSHSSGGSKTSVAAKSLNRLRRALSAEHQPLLRGLWWLLVVGILLTFLAIGLSIMVVLVTRNSFMSFLDNVNYTSLGSQRLLAKSSALRSLQDLVYHARTWVHLNETDIAAHRSYVLGNMTLFSELHSQMHAIALSANMADWVGDFIPVTQFDIPNNTITGNMLYLNQYEAGVYMARQLQRAAEFPVSQLAEIYEPTLMQLIIYDGMRNGVMHETLAQSANVGYSLTMQSKDDIIAFVSGIIGAMLGLVLAISVCVFLPILRSVDRSADLIVLQFVALPVPVKNAMSGQMQGRMRALRRQYAGDDEEDEFEDSEEEGNNAAAFVSNDPNAADDQGDANGDGEIDWSQLLSSHSGDAIKRSRSTKSESGSERSRSNTPAPRSTTQRYRPTVHSPVPAPASASAAASARGPGGFSSRVHPVQATDQQQQHQAEQHGDGEAVTMLTSASNPNNRPHVSSPPPFIVAPGSSSTALIIAGPSSLGPAASAAVVGTVPSTSSNGTSDGPASSYARRSVTSMRGKGNLGAVSVTSLKRGVAYRKSSRAFTLLVLRFVGPLVALFLLFAIIEIVFLVTMSQATTLISVAAAGNARASNARAAAIDLRKLSYLVTDAPYIIQTYAFSMQSFEGVSYHVRLLGLGKPPETFKGADAYASQTQPVENGLPSVLPSDITEKVFQAMYGDACSFLRQHVYNDGRAFDMKACYDYNGGVLKRGLASALSLWHQDAERIGDRQLRGQFIVGHLFEGAGWSIPSSLFDYNSVLCLPERGCRLDQSFARPTDGSPLPPTPLSDLSYQGDWPDGVSPGTPGGPPAGAVPYLIGNEQKHPEMLRVQTGDGLYLTPALYAVANMYDEEAQNVINNFISFLIVFTASYMAVFVLVVLFSFLPNVRKTNSDLVSKRSLLLYLPPQVIARTPALQALIDEILAADDGATGGGGSSAGGAAGSFRGGGGSGSSGGSSSGGSDAGSVGTR